MKLISLRTNHSDAHNRLGTNYKKLNDDKNAIKQYELAIKCNKENKTAYNNLGNIYALNPTTWSKAEQCYIKSIAIDTKYAPGHTNYGALLRKLGRYEDAKYHYECALKLSNVYLCIYNLYLLRNKIN